MSKKKKGTAGAAPKGDNELEARNLRDASPEAQAFFTLASYRGARRQLLLSANATTVRVQIKKFKREGEP